MKTPWSDLLRSDPKSATAEKNIVDVKPIIESVPTGKIQLGDVIDGDIVYKIDSTHAWLVAPAEKRIRAPWGLDCTDTALPNITSVDDPNSGEYNTEMLVAGNGPRAVSAYYCENQTGGGHYFLPNKQELVEIFNLKSNIDASDRSGGRYTLRYFFSSSSYVWSSTEYNDERAWFLYFGRGNFGKSYKNSINLFVIPVRKIKL